MKELSIEEKAKRYDIALDKIKMLLGSGSSCSREELKYVFPELAESEDEMFRKYILKCCEQTISADDRGLELSMNTTIRLKNWLEKQGEQPKKHDVCDNCDQQGSCVSPCPMKLVENQGEQEHVVVIPKFRVGDVIRPKGSTAEYTIESISGECYHGKGWGLHISCDNDYELVEQKPAEWNEEDDILRRRCIGAIQSSSTSEGVKKELVDWLKSLKDRVQLQPRQEWSEDDEEIRKSIIDRIERRRMSSIGSESAICENQINWLKSLSSQSHWKPSDEQMDALNDVISSRDIKYDVLSELWKDLKNLKD